MQKFDYALFSNIARTSEQSLLKVMKVALKKYYSDVFATKDWIFCEGKISLMLVAHMDTVFKAPPKKIYHDEKQHIIWSPQGLGADDRAGVFAILKILESGARPHILLTTKEEKGGFGALLFLKSVPNPPCDIKYIVELDRRGEDDCVFYGCANKDFQSFIESYGFYTEWGIFSDISDICPRWGIAGVNLSVGYENEHSFIETLNTEYLYNTIEKVKNMIKDIHEAPYFEYKEDMDSFYYGYGRSHIQYLCSKCKMPFPEEEIFAIKTKAGGFKYMCPDCIGNDIEFCSKCNNFFEKEAEGDIYCHDCR